MLWFTINGGGGPTLLRLAQSLRHATALTHWRILMQGRSGAPLRTLEAIKEEFKDRVTISIYPFNLGPIQAWNENLSWHQAHFCMEPFCNCDDDIELIDPKAGEYLMDGLAAGYQSCANRVSWFGPPMSSETIGTTTVPDHATAFAAYRAGAAALWHDWRRVQYGHDTEWHLRMKQFYAAKEVDCYLSVDWGNTARHYNQTGTFNNFEHALWHRFMETDKSRKLPPLRPADKPPILWWQQPDYVIDL